MTLKNAALFALIGMLLLTVLVSVDLIRSVSNVLGGLMLHIQIANQAMQIIRMQPQQPRGFGIVALRLFEGVQDELLLGLAQRVVKGFVMAGAGDSAFSRTASGRSSGRIRSEDPSTTARSMAFSSSRTLPGQS
jgi:hypothetical protein